MKASIDNNNSLIEQEELELPLDPQLEEELLLSSLQDDFADELNHIEDGLDSYKEKDEERSFSL